MYYEQPGFIINNQISIPWRHIKVHAIRAQGPGGQHVNKTSSAVCIQVDLKAIPLPDHVRRKLYSANDSRISSAHIVTVKSQLSRQQQINKEDALKKLRAIFLNACHIPKARRPTKPTKGSKERRLTGKKTTGQKKQMRRAPNAYD